MNAERRVWKDVLACKMETKKILAVFLILYLGVCLSYSQELNPKGRNVCRAMGSFVCCPGWKQHVDECITPVCKGNFTCKENEVCVRPNECRCRHGYFGANCETKCPGQFFGPDCKEMCTCHPNGRCDDVIGKCTCNPNRWGVKCENQCLCQRGKCDQDTGKCTCDTGWWGPQCSNTCYCSSSSVCEQSTGRCICQPGWWGRTCNSQCPCSNSPCEQFSGRCQCHERLWGTRCERYCQCVHGKCNQADGSCTCKPGYRGKFCREPCPAGFYGQGCRRRCGRCKQQQPCTVTEGRCLTCEAGWNGTQCDQICNAGFFGGECKEVCPPCRDGHPCNHVDGKCTHCNPGWIGDRCEIKCPNGTYGENCKNICNDCFNGECHFATGECLCNPGSYGTNCNMTCPAGQYGVNCAHACSCHENTCNSTTGECFMQPNQRMGVIAAGALVIFLLILLLSLLCCCCVCRKKNKNDPEHDNSANSKKAGRRLCGRFSRISTKFPRIPLRRQKLPKVVVAHHDPENTFNCSFIEPPSAVEQPSPSWSSRGSFSSFETSDDGPVYCVPHEESMSENKEKGSSNVVEKIAPPISEEDAGEYTSLKDTGKALPGDTSETPLLKSSDSEGSTSGSESTSGALYARIARLSKQSEDENSSSNVKGNGKPPSPERAKPRPPDPSTKPKVSWIHGKVGNGQNPESSQGPVPTKDKRRSHSETSGKSEEKHSSRTKEKAAKHNKEQSSPEGKGSEEARSPSKHKSHKTRAGQEQMEHINGAVQNALKKIGNFHGDKKGSETKEVPKSPNKSRSEVIHPHMNSEAATLLAAQLKEKTQSINRCEGMTKQNGVASPQSHREKPTPPQKTKRSAPAGPNHNSSKPLLPTSSSLQKIVVPVSETISSEAKSPERQDLNNLKQDGGDPTPKKTPIKKPPRKKGKEGTLDSHPKTAIMPPQMVK
ncbi:scavenger receptor class F member 2-like [Acipenser oxyrinchus oxyrinchus]|uniref:Scavenger receptor class F member 2-like n=1 Tax=Acipenser oxyrinchus oxyrinchus TaxID=40147 RepID=A0AAD8FZZ5_ACIOX|nr:scavenger receptor class F member 2-like [Acipenser oxyrinchus oxyrinchus]